jgi:cytochrome c biogenesis protein
MRCPTCGTENSEESKFCRECGTALRADAAAPTPVRDGTTGVIQPQTEQELSFDEKVELIRKELMGLNCGRCGFESCAENAESIVRGESPYDSCAQAPHAARERIRRILGLRERSPLGLRLWWALTSVKLALGLIAALVLISIIGTVIPQGQSDMSYFTRYGPTGYKLIKTFMINQLFHSWYYLGLLGLLGLNTLACLTKRFQVSLRLLRRSRAQSPTQILKLENSAELSISGGPTKALEQVGELLKRRRYRVIRQGAQLRAHKNLVGRLGVDIFHASLLLLFIGALLGGIVGYEAFITGHKGEVLDVPGGDFQIRVDDLWTESYEGTSRIKDWYTKLTVIDGGREVVTQTIEVNHPLTYKGVSLYQASFGNDWLKGAQLTFAVQRVSDEASLGEYEVLVGETFPLDPEANLTAKLVAFYPHFVMTDQGPINRSPRLDNPAAFLEVYEGETLKFRGWTFAHFPDMQIWVSMEPESNPTPETGGETGHGAVTLPYRVDLVGMHAPEFTGLQVSYNPGIWLIYLSFALMVLGMFLNFYLPPRWVWAQAERGRVRIGGIGRDDREFMGEFETLVEQVRAALPTVPAPVEAHAGQM